jgi:hypothetical protein
MTKGEIIEGILKELRSNTPAKRKRPSEDDEEEQNVITYLEKALRDAQPDTDIRTCTDFIHLNVECCTTCHFFMFPYDMPLMVKLKSGEYAWIRCAVSSVIKNAAGDDTPVKSPLAEQPAKSTGYKPFAEFFGKKGSGQRSWTHPR